MNTLEYLRTIMSDGRGWRRRSILPILALLLCGIVFVLLARMQAARARVDMMDRVFVAILAGDEGVLRAALEEDNSLANIRIYQLAESGEVDVRKYALSNDIGVEATPLIFLSGIATNDVQAAHLSQILLTAGADPNGMDRVGATALHYSIERCLVETTRELLRMGADPNKGTAAALIDGPYSQCPIHVAAIHCPQVVSDLLIAGAEVDTRDSNGNTALHLAAIHGEHEVIAVLLSHEADLTIKNRKGYTASDYIAHINKMEGRGGGGRDRSN